MNTREVRVADPGLAASCCRVKLGWAMASCGGDGGRGCGIRFDVMWQCRGGLWIPVAELRWSAAAG